MADWAPPDLHAEEPQPRDTAELFAAIGRRLAAAADHRAALALLVDMAVQVVPGARWVSITRGSGHRFATLTSSDPVALAADRVQYELGTGPCVEAIVDDAVFTSGDLAVEQRWSGFGPRVAREHGARSVLSMRLTLETDDDVNAAFNLYGDHVDAFDDVSRYFATLLATHAAVAVAAVVGREHTQQLREALDSNREIGVAMGVVMATLKVTREQAFDLLRVASQNTNRKVRDIATVVADTGVLEVPAARRHHR